MSMRGGSHATWLLALLLCVAGITLLSGPGEAHAQDVVDPAAEEAFFTGIALLEAGDAAAAIAKFDQALRIQKDLRRVLFYRARAWTRLGDIAEARADADAYEATNLSAGEREQLAELRKEIDARAAQVGEATTRTPVDRRPANDERIEDAGPDGFALLRAAEEALARGDCAAAGEKAQDALSVDNTLSRAFLIKGLALECEGELERARDLIGTYTELRGSQSPDPVAAAALERIKSRLAGETATSTPVPTGPSWTVIGDDDAIQGLLDQQWGMPQDRALEVRTRRQVLQNVGAADVGRPRMTVGGSNARVERAWVVDQRGMLWTRLRVFERSGLETTDWFVRSFSELYRTVERDAGRPAKLEGIEGPVEDGNGAHKALKGLTPFRAEWSDTDGDTIQLRLGRCTVPGEVNRVHPDTAPCLELVGWSGVWRPESASTVSKASRAAAVGERPGLLAPDLAGGLGVGFGPSFWSTSGGAAFGGEAGLDVQLRLGLGAFVVGAGWAFSVTGYSNLSGLDSGAFADNRIMGYVGVRDRPRQRHMTDIMLGGGVVPEANGAAPAIAFRVVSQVRIAPVARFFVSFEPYVALGTDVSVVPIRLSLGILFGTKMHQLR